MRMECTEEQSGMLMHCAFFLGFLVEIKYQLTPRSCMLY